MHAETGPDRNGGSPGTTTSRARRSVEISIALASLAAWASSVAALRSDSAAAGIAVVVALAWGVAPFAVRAVLGGHRHRRLAVLPSEPGDLTTIVCVGREPLDVARATIILAARSGPTVVVTTRVAENADDLAPVGVPVFVRDSFGDALDAALDEVRTDAVFVTSASAFPTPAAARAAALLTDEVGWVVGRVEPFTTDTFGPASRSAFPTAVRARVRAAGLSTWEPDATIVRTDLFRSAVTGRGAPRGTLLRSCEADGLVGVECAEVVAVEAAPTDGPLFWPADVMAIRGETADLARAVSGARRGVRTRLLAVAELLRVLAAYQAALWLAVPVLVSSATTFPFRIHPVVFGAVHGFLAVARWAWGRLAVGVRPDPASDALAAVYQAPASLLALPSVFGRIRPLRVTFPAQPLLLAAVAATVALTVPLLDRPATADSGVDATVGAALIGLVLVWACAVHAIGPRAWGRSSYRLRVDAPVQIDGVAGRLRDGSPSGAAVVGPFDDVHPGEVATCSVTFPEGTEVTTPALVVDRHAAGDEWVLGLSLVLDGPAREVWVRGLIDPDGHFDGRPAADRSGRGRGRPPTVEMGVGRRSRFGRRLEGALVAALSVVVLGAVTLSIVGYQVLVVRSESMVPTLQVGDVAVADWVRAGEVRIGDVISFRSDQLGEASVTHRVRNVDLQQGELWFETRGDANDASEFWPSEPDALVGRVVAHVPGAGSIVGRLGRTRSILAGTALTAVVVALVLARDARRRAIGRRSAGRTDHAPPEPVGNSALRR